MLLEGSTDSTLRIGLIVICVLAGGFCKFGFIGLLRRSANEQVPIPRIGWFLLLGFLLILGGVCSISGFLFGESGNTVWIIRGDSRAPLVTQYVLYGKTRIELQTGGYIDLEERSRVGTDGNLFLNDTSDPLVYSDSVSSQAPKVLLPAKGVTWAYQPVSQETISLKEATGDATPNPSPQGE